MLSEKQAEAFVVDQISAFYSRLASGWDLSPGERLRFEGKVELLLECQLIEWTWLIDTTKQLLNDVLEYQPEEAYWLWLESEQCYYLPHKMMDAPVYKK